MTDFNASNRDVGRAIRSWLNEDRHEDASGVAGAVLDRLDTIPQRRASWPAWRTPPMNRFLAIGFGAAAVVVLGAVLGTQLLSSPGLDRMGGPPSTAPTASAEPTQTPQPTPEGLLPEGPHVLWDGPLGVTISVTLPAPGWHGEPGGGILTKNGDVGAPDGAGLIVFARTNDLLVGMGDVRVYGDPCRWTSTTPESPVTTVDEAIAALSGQASRNASEPEDVVLDGHEGKRVTLHVPDDVVLADCDGGEFRTLSEGDDASRHHQDPGQIDLIWVLDVNGELVIIDVAFYEGTPDSVLDEMGAIVESATLSYSP